MIIHICRVDQINIVSQKLYNLKLGLLFKANILIDVSHVCLLCLCMELDIPLIRNKASGPGTNNFGYSEEISEYPEGEQAGQDQDVCSRKREASGIERTVQYRKELCVFRFRESRKKKRSTSIIWIYINFTFSYRALLWLVDLCVSRSR